MKLYDRNTDPVAVAIEDAVPGMMTLSEEAMRCVVVAARDACGRELLADMEENCPADGNASQRRRRGYLQRAIYLISPGLTEEELAATQAGGNGGT